MNQSISLLSAIFIRRRWPALITFISIICGSAAYLLITPRLYETTVRIMLDDKQLSVAEFGHDLTTQTDTPHANPIATEAELARSERVLQQALNMIYANKIDNLPKNKVTLNQLKSGLKVSIVPATNILEISYKSQDPLLTAEVLNAVVVAMESASTDMIRSQARSAREFLEVEVPKKRGQLARAEAALTQYKQSHGIVSLTDTNGQDNTQMRSLIESLTNAENQEQALSAQLKEVKVRNNSIKKITDFGTIKNNYLAVRIGQDEELKRLRIKLADLESEVAIGRKRLTDNNPSLLNLLEKRDTTRALYNQRLSRLLPKDAAANPPANIASDQVSQDLSNKLIAGEIERSALETKLAAVRKEQANFQARLNQIPAKLQELAVLTRQRQESASSLESLQHKLDETRIAEVQLLGQIRLIDSAKPPTVPTWPKTSIVLVIATAAGIVLTIGVVLLLEVLDNTLCNATEAGNLVNLPILSVLPIQPTASLGFENLKLFLEDAESFESYRTLLKSMEFFSGRGRDVRVVIVGSSVSGEGKSVVVSQLATVSAMLFRRTLIIDADLRRPTQHKLFNLTTQPGLTDVINGHVAVAEAVQQTSIKNLWTLTCGETCLYPSQVLESDNMRSLLAEASTHYDLVIVDTQPLESCVDATTLSRYSDGLLLVVRPNFTPKNVLIETVTKLTSSQIPIIGVAVNASNTQTNSLRRWSTPGHIAKVYSKKSTNAKSCEVNEQPKQRYRKLV